MLRRLNDMPARKTPKAPPAPPAGLLDALRTLIDQGRQRALRAVDMVQVRTCWEIGRHIVEFEQEGATRAAYGQRLLPQLAETLTREFGKGFDASNLRYVRLFYQAFPIRDALRHELSWTHYRTLLRIDDEKARHWYMNEAAAQNWSAHAQDRQIAADDLLCEHKAPSVVRYSVLHDSAHLFAAKYKLVLPSEEELRAELERERSELLAQQSAS